MPTAVKKFQCAPPSRCYAQAVSAAIDLANTDAATGVVLTVCHAGRDYPAGIEDRLALPMARVRQLEDGYADLLIDRARSDGHATLVARTPRLIIDLNRDETDFLSQSIGGAGGMTARPSHRARGGLGLIPERLGRDAIWRTPVTARDLVQRIVEVHRPWHAAVDAALACAVAPHGRAILIDIHSMPPLPGAGAAQIVIGTRHGTSARTAVAHAAAAVFRSAGLRTAVDSPYAGAHMIERHGRPGRGVDAVQIEIDRRLYLGPEDEGLGTMRRLIADLATRLSVDIARADWPLAAE